jgi:hypothetical protein
MQKFLLSAYLVLVAFVVDPVGCSQFSVVVDVAFFSFIVGKRE